MDDLSDRLRLVIMAQSRFRIGRTHKLKKRRHK